MISRESVLQSATLFHYLANLQIHVKPQNEKSRKGFSKGKKGMTNQAGQRGIFANRLSRTIISG